MDSIPIQCPANTCRSIYRMFPWSPLDCEILSSNNCVSLIFESQVLTQDLEYGRNARNICLVSWIIRIIQHSTKEVLFQDILWYQLESTVKHIFILVLGLGISIKYMLNIQNIHISLKAKKYFFPNLKKKVYLTTVWLTWLINPL